MITSCIEILWHGKQPVLSVDFEPEADRLRFATSGQDENVRIWALNTTNEKPSVEFLSTLIRHSGAVNCVRWAPTGKVLATAGDDGVVILWHQVQKPKVAEGMNDENREESSENWKLLSCLTPSGSEIYDLAWSPDGKKLMGGCIDHTVRIWNVHDGRSAQVLKDHDHYVQGVAWDPRNQFVLSQSADRSINVYKIRTAGNKQSNSVVEKFGSLTKHHMERDKKVESAEISPSKSLTSQHIQTNRRYFCDETLPSFFRRLTFSPDGAYVIAPAGIYYPKQNDLSESTEHVVSNVVYIFARNRLNGPPICCLAGLAQPPVAIRANPVKFTRVRPQATVCTPACDQGFGALLPYRMVFAVASSEGINIYDTERPKPIAVVLNLHYSAITDLAWSPDGKILLVTSIDGFCSIIAFQNGELGNPLADDSGSTCAVNNGDFAPEDLVEVITDNQRIASGNVQKRIVDHEDSSKSESDKQDQAPKKRRIQPILIG
ncbi:WD repeat protein Cac2 [Cladochytrium replicatum]|nr:WD repeat protein Cac2 [Cladochytrium replicatum]